MCVNDLISVEVLVKKQENGELFVRLNQEQSGDKCIDFNSKCGQMVYKSEYHPGVEASKFDAHSNTTFFELSDVFKRLKHGSLITVLDFKESDNEIKDSEIKADRTNKGCYKIDNYRVAYNKSLSELSTYIWLVEYFKIKGTFESAQDDFKYHKDKIRVLLDEKTFSEVEELMGF